MAETTSFVSERKRFETLQLRITLQLSYHQNDKGDMFEKLLLTNEHVNNPNTLKVQCVGFSDI